MGKAIVAIIYGDIITRKSQSRLADTRKSLEPDVARAAPWFFYLRGDKVEAPGGGRQGFNEEL